MSGAIRLERDDEGVVVLTVDNPPVNALSTAVLGELGTAAEELAGEAALKAVVVAGAGKAFAAGADVTEFGGPDEARVVTDAFRRALDRVASVPRPVIAAIHGVALGGGLELALACDFRVAASRARVGQPEILLGTIPGGGGSQRLARLIGPARTKAILFSGEQIAAPEAAALGIVDRVVDDDPLVAARGWARELATGPVVAMGLAKRAVDEGLERPLAEGLELESARFVESFETEDARAGVASFLEHGPGRARFSGR